MTDYRAAWERLLPDVTTPAQYVGGERNSVVKPRGEAAVRLCLAFPDTYAVGMSHIGLDILYGTINRRPDAAAERAFTPWGDMETRLRAAGLPLVSLETFTPLREFDIVGFSLQYEMGYTNVLTMLDLGGIPIEAAQRALDDPLVIAGGPCALHPEPMADFIDVFFLGEAEETIHAFLDIYRAVRAEHAPQIRGYGSAVPGGDRGALARAPKSHRPEREAFLLDLARRSLEAGLTCLYFPALYEARPSGEVVPAHEGLPAVLDVAYVADLENAYYPTAPVVPFVETVHDRITIEIMRGCPHRCRFCEAGHSRGRARIRSMDRIVELAEATYRNTGFDEIGLVSLSSGDYPRLEELVARLNARFAERAVNVSLPSLRVTDRLARLPKLLGGVRRSSLTLAPEAGSERLRRVIGKRISDDDLLEGVEAAFRHGWSHVKLYFMIGLPTETEEDLRAAAALVKQVAAVGRKVGRGGRVNLAVSAFVPKPHTPFQWEAMGSLDVLRAKRSLLAEAVRSRSIAFKSNRLERSVIEAALGRGDRRMGRAVRRAWEAGARFDAWDEFFTLEAWQAAFEACGIDPDQVVHRPLPLDRPLPWSHIRCFVSASDLAAERERALAGKA